MTLCAAWIREKNDVEELVFATDSSLTGGEKWNQGIKLFELPRPDCLICFAGSTGRAYPLILNLIASIKLNNRLQNPHTDLEEVLDYLSNLFTSLVHKIINEVSGQDIHALRSEAKFIFGGWSWLKSCFRVWKLYYSPDAEGFIFQEYTGKVRTYAFLGDPESLEERAKDLLFDQELEDRDDPLDLEPLKVLINLSRSPDTDDRNVDGAIQIAKVYKSGTSEFFGIYWRSIAEKPHFQGRAFDSHNKPNVRYFDPDTLLAVEDKLPELIPDLNIFSQLEDFDFICECYSGEDNSLNNKLSERDRERLIYVLREAAYQNMMKDIDEQKAGINDLEVED